jgi:hypothetical protein
MSFCTKPFCDEDAVVLCYTFYMPMDKGVSPSLDDEPVDFADAAQKVFEARGCQHTPVGLVLTKDISKAMMQMTEIIRFAQMKVVGVKTSFDFKPAVQFNAGTYLLPSGESVVIFQGTDDTLKGWEEDFNILSNGTTPSEQLSVDYLAEVAAKFDGDIIVCGHSKGGYVAQYAAMNSPKEIRDRIKLIYNLDGPGLANYDYLDTDVYDELLPRYRHFVPHSSFIGMMLAHDSDYMIVKANRITGALQHDLFSWQFKQDKLWLLDDLHVKSKFTDLTFQGIREGFDDGQKEVFGDVLNTVIDGMGQHGLLDVKDNVKSALKGGADAWKSIDPDTKKVFLDAVKGAGASAKAAVKTIANGEYKAANERIK